jgi:hypothetical protein
MVVIKVSACTDVLFSSMNSITLAVKYTVQQQVFITRLQSSDQGIWVQFPAEERDFSLLQICSETHSISCLIGTRDSFPRAKVART